ncbi:MAG TPA: TetR/AcrR family transcriptional regulator [Actinocrinis sp.]|nr:TetR/AcrR family transcriptional regulator [Actinocrinis sp.]
MPDGEMTPQQRTAETKRKRTREWIITSTLDLYGELDKGDFTRDQIAEAAGVGSTTLSNHFTLKFEVLRAAHERLLAPIIEPITSGQENGTYKPDDGRDELIRYLYAVAKLSQKHRALTVAMIRAYYETGPEFRHELYDMGKAVELHHHRLDKMLSGHIVEGLYPVFHTPPFRPASPTELFGHTPRPRSYLENSTVLRFMNTLLNELYHRPAKEAPLAITRDVGRDLLAVALPDEDTTELFTTRLPLIQRKVDNWFEQRKQREERGW